MIFISVVIHLVILSLQLNAAYCDVCDCSKKVDFLQDILQEEIMERKLMESQLLDKIDSIQLHGGATTTTDSSVLQRLDKLEEAIAQMKSELKKDSNLHDQTRSLQAVVKKAMVREKKINNIFRADIANKTKVSAERMENFTVNMDRNFKQITEMINSSIKTFGNESKTRLAKMEDENVVRFEQLKNDTTGTLETFIQKTTDEYKLFRAKILSNITANTQSIELVQVNLVQTKTDGAWSSWSSWGSCSVTCGGGVRSRSRTCTNPAPVSLGRSCSGNNHDVDSCNSKACNPPCDYCKPVAFTIYGSVKGIESDVIWFDKVITDMGGDYLYSEGQFSCKVPGVYYFTTTLTKKKRHYDKIQADIVVNDDHKLTLFSDPDESGTIDHGSYSVSGAGTFTLNESDKVYIKGVTEDYYKRLYDDNKSYFSGIRIASHTIAFTAYGSKRGFSSSVIRFDKEVTNLGASLDASTGLFQCNFPGVYHFSVTLTKRRYHYDLISAFIVLNNEPKLQLHADPVDSWSVDYGSYSLTAAATFKLNKGDKVYIRGQSDGYHERFFDDKKSFFTGFFIASDTIAFTVYGSSQGAESGIIRFNKEILNIGADYDSTSGRFKCKVPGLYHFAVTLTKRRGNYNLTSAYMMVNEDKKIALYTDPDDSGNVDYGSYSISGAINIELLTGDSVYIKGDLIYYFQRFYDDKSTFFTGFLMSKF